MRPPPGKNRLQHPRPQRRGGNRGQRVPAAGRGCIAAVERHRTQCPGPLSSGGAHLRADCLGAGSAHRHGANASAPWAEEAAGGNRSQSQPGTGEEGAMHKDTLRQDHSTPASLDACADARVVRALERLPESSKFKIPADFAARVAASVPARRPVAIHPPHYGRTVAFVCVFVLFATLLAAAPQGLDHSALGFALECLLVAAVSRAGGLAGPMAPRCQLAQSTEPCPKRPSSWAPR